MFAINNIFQITSWILNRALREDLRLQPQKLHALLFLSQLYYCAGFKGKKLMPATFIMEKEIGPFEVNTYYLMQKDQNTFNSFYTNFEDDPNMKYFIEGIWLKFSKVSANLLKSYCTNNIAWKNTLEKPNGSEISFFDIKKAAYELATTTPPQTSSEQIKQFRETDINKIKLPLPKDVVIKRKIQTVTGKHVQVSKWNPRQM